ncbi:MAG: alanine racemase [Methylophilaceae bacterium]|nr:alanine racemase [Methylophilaceae bacterium]
MRPLQATIDTAALRHNLALVRTKAADSKVLSVIKANGYGHGMLRVARALSDSDGFAVLRVEEGVALRQAGFRQLILLLEGLFGEDELPVASAHALAVVVHCEEQLAMLEAARGKYPLDVFLKINTGMNRLGISPDRFRTVYDRLEAVQGVRHVTLMTHFATADGPQGVAEQLACFNALTQGIHRPKSLANSAALLRFPETHEDWVRPGIMLYGASPFEDETAWSLGLKPAMTLSSAIIAEQWINAGARVGYGGSFRAEQPMRIGVVSCGYADGYPRHAPTGTPVAVAGKLTRTLGRVSMDMLCVDLSSIPEAHIGSPVELWGAQVPVDAVAHAAGTVGYELLCRVAARVPMVEC